ncbi:MAG: hypothetical protein HZA02_09575 [Nitrospinae bacterium]|nr:hypothetical protein [Nitrospinota bacterium]
MPEKDIIQIEQDVNQIKGDIVSLKSDLRNLYTKIETELKYMATKADVEQMGRVLVMWMVGSIIAVSGIVFAVARYIR